MKIYLVGMQEWHTEINDVPNCNEFPRYVFTDLKKAEGKYNQVERNEDLGIYGHIMSYLVEMDTETDGYTILKGNAHL